MTVEQIFNLADIKSVQLECDHCHRNRTYSAAGEILSGTVPFPPSRCVCDEPIKEFIAIIAAVGRKPGYRMLLKFNQ